jgi:hypothetical protein
MKIKMGEWHTYPTGCGYQLIRPICGGEGGVGEEECCIQSREREWGRRKKEERRKNEEESD